MAAKVTEERALTEQYGYTADSSWLPRSPAAALIAGGDWALEYPMPIPPKVHVSQTLEPAYFLVQNEMARALLLLHDQQDQLPTHSDGSQECSSSSKQ